MVTISAALIYKTILVMIMQIKPHVCLVSIFTQTEWKNVENWQNDDLKCVDFYVFLAFLKTMPSIFTNMP